jgi:dihydrofolate reductase
MAALHHTAHPSVGPRQRRALELVVAMDRNGAIGYRNALPWRLPADLKRFRELTGGHAVIMGRKTWESIGRPLPDRQNIVVSRRADFMPDAVHTAHSLDEAIDMVRLPGPIFCIGGAELFRVALPRAKRLHITEIAAEFPGDTFFPLYDRSVWRETAREEHPASGDIAFDYAFVTYDRVSQRANDAPG